MKTKTIAILAVAIVVVAGIVVVVAGTGKDHEVQKEETITDMLGRTVSYPSDVKRVACFGATLRLYCYAGDLDKVVALEGAEFKWQDYEGRPYMLANKDRFDKLKSTDVGHGFRDAPDKEKLLDANLDVLFMMLGREKAEVDQLQKDIKTPIIVLSMGTNTPFDENVYQSLRIIGKVVDSNEKAESAISYFKATESDLKKRVASVPDANRPTAYVGGLPFAGAHGIESTTVRYCLFDTLGVKNAYDLYVKANNKTVSESFHLINFETLVDMDPEKMILDEGGLQLIKGDYIKHPNRYNNLSAFKNGNIWIQQNYNWYYANLELVLANGYYIGKVLYPDQFKDVVVKDKFNEICQNLLGKSMYDEIKVKNTHSYSVWNPVTHKVNATAGTGYTVTFDVKDPNAVCKGTMVTAKVTLTSGYSGTPVVKVNGKDIAGSGGSFTFKLLEDSDITVSGVKKS